MALSSLMWRRLLLLVSTFTLAHTLTLAQLDKITLFPLSSKDDIDILIIGTGEYSQFLNPLQQVALHNIK
jgi:uncharacterized protein